MVAHDEVADGMGRRTLLWAAVQALGQFESGARALLAMHKRQSLPDELRSAATGVLALAPWDAVRAEVEKALTSYGTPSAGHGHVFNLGHGISQFTPPESVTAMVEAVHAISRRQRAG